MLILLLAWPEISGQNYFWKSVDPSFDSLMVKAELLSNREADYDQMIPLIDRMYRLACRNGGNRVMLSRARFWDIWANSRKNENFYYSLIEKTAGTMDTVEYAYDYHRLMMIKQAILSSRGEYLDSYMLAGRLASYFEDKGDRVHWAYCMGNISNIFADLNEYGEAVGYAEKARTVFESYGLKGKMLLILLNLANTYNHLNRREEALELLKPVVENFPAEANQKIRILYLMAYCNYLQAKEEKEFYIEKTYRAALNYSDPYFLQMAMLNKGSLFLQSGNPDSARIYLKKVRATLVEDPNPVVREKTYDLLSLLFASENRYDSAFHYQILYRKYQDSLRGGKVLLDVHRIKVRKDIDDYRSQLEQSKQETQTQRRFVTVVLVVFVIILLMSAVIFRLLIKRAAMEKKLREVEGKEYHERIRNEQLVIDSQNRELSSNTILLTKKNLILKNLLQQLTSLENGGKLDSKTGKSLKNSIEVTLREDDEWDYFKLHFQQVHPDFFSKLKDSFPDLTDNELRLCAYSRLNLSIKQIAQMLSVQPKTIVQARYRMRKKMNLDNEELLNDFLRNFG